MAKMKVSKSKHHPLKKKQSRIHIYTGMAVISLGIISLYGLAKVTFSSPHVLGTSTLVARGGDEASGSDTSGGSGSSGGSSSDSSTSGSSSGDSGSSTSGDNSTTLMSTSGSTTDLKQIAVPMPSETELENETNDKSSTSDLKDDSNMNSTLEQENEQEPVEVSSKDQQEKVNLKKHGTVVELRTSLGKIELEAKQEDGTHIELDENSLKTMNDVLAKDNQSEIEHDASGSFVLKHGSIQAKTTLPLSINLVTHELSVTTSKGTKIVAILPDEAVNRLVALKVIDSLDSQSNDTVKLTENNDKAVFEVNGIDNQKLFGIIPVKIHKNVQISAATGSLESTNETFAQKLLDLLSL